MYRFFKHIFDSRSFVCGLYLIFFAGISAAQTLPVGTPVLEDYYRRQQLLGFTDSSISFTIQPVIPFQNGSDSISTEDKRPVVQILPLSLQQQINTHHPYGWNDGAMIPAKGYQMKFSAGVFAKMGFLSIQLRPEYVYAQNSGYRALDIYGGAPDLPAKFGNSPYSKLTWGQSALRINGGPISLGLSNENLRWGPGVRNSLLMSNNAAGFKHVTINTARPVRTPIGALEFQMIGGKLGSSGHTFLERDTAYSDWRYLSSFALSYQPKWVPGLFLGLTRAFQMYKKDVSGLSDYFPLFQPFQKNRTDEDSKRRDQLTSLFARWLLVKAHAEIYLEYGLNDHSYNFRDFLGSPEHSRAYIFGMAKLVRVRSQDNEYIQIRGELTQMSQSMDRTVREAGAWYYHSQILQGYTHKGEVLGAGVGPGGNLQSLDISWYKDLKHIGILFERYEHNADYYNAVFANGGKWVDFSAAAVSDWQYKNLIFNTKIQAVQSLNYQWRSGINGLPKQNVLNLHAELGVMYRF